MFYLSLRGHGPCGHSHCVDSSVGVFVYLDVRFLLHVPCGVEQVQNFLIIKLQEGITPENLISKMHRRSEQPTCM